ncbi:hypothetical protein [Actinoplanes sp. NPDC048796]|uniref:Hsp70 family protein n=1 Tax=Actinoplanes sp. NPDC048796 TaxID=3155640 RepID=UPI0033FAD819
MTAEARYVIGLDIGDGESCLAWAPLDRSEPTRIYTRQPSMERSIVTAVAQSPSGRLIGDDAVTRHGATNFSVNFKEVPNSAETPAAVVFAQSLLAEFRECHPEVVADGVAFVGHPAGWPAEAVASYGRHLGLLGLPVRLMPESQSALLHVRDRCQDDRRLERVLIVDVGSSTTDFTVVEDLSPRNLPVGAALGCRRIDQELAGRVRAALRHDTALMAALDAEGGPEFLLLACRWAKEAQFSGRSRRIMDLREACEERFRPIVAAAWTWLLNLEIAPMVAAPGGWGEKFRTALAEAANLLGDRPPRLVVLTGGGSRMPIAGRLCREVFPASELEHDDDPSFAVARGLVSNGQQQAVVRRFRRDVSGLMRAPATEATVRAEAVLALDDMKARVTAQATEAHGSAADLTRRIKIGMFEAACALSESLEFHLAMRVRKICRNYGIPGDDVRLGLAPLNVFEEQLDRILHLLGQFQRLTEHTSRVGFAGIPQDVARHALSSGLEQARKKFASPLIPGMAQQAINAAVSHSGLGADFAARARILYILRGAEYSPEQLDQIVAQVLAAITAQVDTRAGELERWLA